MTSGSGRPSLEVMSHTQPPPSRGWLDLANVELRDPTALWPSGHPLAGEPNPLIWPRKTHGTQIW